MQIFAILSVLCLFTMAYLFVAGFRRLGLPFVRSRSRATAFLLMSFVAFVGLGIAYSATQSPEQRQAADDRRRQAADDRRRAEHQKVLAAERQEKMAAAETAKTHQEVGAAVRHEKLENSGVARLPNESDSDMAVRIQLNEWRGTPLNTPFINVTVTSGVYEYGYLTVHGVAENTGAQSAFSPAIELRVYDSDTGDVLLAADTAYPTGTLLAQMQSGQKAAFQHMTSVPGKPGRVRWEVTVNDYPGQVTMPK